MPIIDILDSDISPSAPDLGVMEVDLALAKVASIKDSSGNSLICNWFDPIESMRATAGGLVQVADSFKKVAMWGEVTAPVGSVHPVFGTDFNGHQTILNPTGAIMGFMTPIAADGSVPNLDRWGMTAVIEPLSSVGAVRFYIFGIGAGPALGAGELYPTLLIDFTSAGPSLCVSEGGSSTIRARSDKDARLKTTRTVVTVTFDTTNGFKFFANGLQIVNTLPLDVRPLVRQTSTYLTNRSGNTPFQGKAAAGILHPAALDDGSIALLHQGLAAYYGITLW